ncbi:hypothetical protein MO867_21550 [Microbulbifer sp. OS29]|uniref:Uncharacterized protein n=1 Tax=Microbulbifer okhotskensis TaxID=2926617 RepID=A0A9X2ERA7_9GAMM|nr:hypothetical protein [Microbulbifer okhotskensis]MCO1336917.1 hypothetical protein [Microbulbifer okhotskensis]
MPQAHDWIVPGIQFLALLVSLTGVLIVIGKRQEQQYEKYLNARFETLNKLLAEVDGRGKESDKRINEIERNLMTLRADLPEKYLRREDHVRSQTVVESKLDAVFIRIENLQLREAQAQ